MSGPTITTWNRLEPRPRTNRDLSFKRELEARVRDPLWFLARQWQLGEFKGEDAASPIFINFKANISRFEKWLPGEGGEVPLLGAFKHTTRPMEALVNHEPFTPDISTCVELGQRLEKYLNNLNLNDPEKLAVREAFQRAFPIRQAGAIRLNKRLFDFLVQDPQPGPDQYLVSKELVPEILFNIFRDNNISLSNNSFVQWKGSGVQWKEHWVIKDLINSEIYALVSFAEFPNRWWVYKAQIIDQETQDFLCVCANRSIDGVNVYQALGRGDDIIAKFPAEVTIVYQGRDEIVPITTIFEDQQKKDELISALSAFQGWVEKVFGKEIDRKDSKDWKANRLEYQAKFLATTPDNEIVTFSADPSRKSLYDWYTFEQMDSIRGRQPGETEQINRTVIPTNVNFRGMAHSRFWQFENRLVNFGNIEPGKIDLAKLAVIDFMLIHGIDWYVLPFTQELGTLCKITTLEVHDVFGGKVSIERADEAQFSENRRWSMFSTSLQNDGNRFADYFILPPSIGTAVRKSEEIEDVRFIRDEMANMVWAIEHITENGIGNPWLGHERFIEGKPKIKEREKNTEQAKVLHYIIQTTVPDHWIPFVPVHKSDGDNRAIILERAAMLDLVDRPYLQNGVEQLNRFVLQPYGRILNPSIQEENYRILEEEVPRAGVQVTRQVYLCRWVDGSTHLWIGRIKRVGRGEGSSNLRFDIAKLE